MNYIRLFSFLTLAIFLGCTKKTPLPGNPGVGVSEISFFSTKVGGSVSGINITDKGVCWSENENPNLSDNHISAGANSESFQITLFGLSPQTKYFVRTYAINEAGTVFSNNLTFTTTTIVALNTNFVSSPNSTSAIFEGAFGNSTSITATEKGICWSTNPNPKITDNKSISTNVSSFVFTATINNLNPATTYYIKAYASFGEGVLYGNETTFTTFGNQIIDVDGNKYNTIKIGNQTWMVENLKVTKYNNGDAIPGKFEGTSWTSTLTLDAYGNYQSNEANKNKFGNFYNYLAVSDARKLAPAGWHIPSQLEWQTLIDYLGGQSLAIKKLLSSNPNDWIYYTPKPTNETKFSALPGGYRGNSGYDSGIENSIYFWTSTPLNNNQSSGIQILADWSNAYIDVTGYDRKSGLYIRCIKD